MIPNILKKGKKGTVLFTVITVMMILTIIMMATFIVIVAAQKQAVNNFTGNQAYITAKSTLDVFVDGVVKNDGGKFDKLRDMMIGEYNSATNAMDGGLDFAGSASSSSDNTLSGVSIKYVEVALPDSRMGALVGDGIKVERIDRTTFKISVTAKHGSARDNTGALTDMGNSIRTVSRMIKLSPNPTNSIFDSALVSCAGNTAMLGTAPQMFGGYVNNSSGDVTINGGVRYIGRVFGRGTIKPDSYGSNSLVEIYLGSKRVSSSSGDVYAVDFIESQNNIQLHAVNVKNIMSSGESPVLYPGFNNPYIYSSNNPPGNAKIEIGSSSGAKSIIGEPGKPVDIYTRGSVVINPNSEVHGNIYAAKGVKIESGGLLDGFAYADNPSTNNGTTPAQDKQIPPGFSYPNDYQPNNYLTVQEVLQQEYKVNGTEYTGTTIKHCFGMEPGMTVASRQMANGLIIKPSDATATVMDGTNMVAGALKLNMPAPAGWEPAGTLKSYSGTVTIELGKEDLFIQLDDTGAFGFNSGGTPYFNGFKVIVKPNSTVSTNPSDFGNVYFYTSGSNSFDVQGINEMYTDWSGFPGVSATYRQYGSKPMTISGVTNTLESEHPSHIFWLIDNNLANAGNPTAYRKLNCNSGSWCMHAYIYAKNVGVCEGPSSASGYAVGIDLPSTVRAYYDNYPSVNRMPSEFGVGSASTLKPAFIGCCIGATTQIGGGYTASVFVDPPRNIFDDTSDEMLKDYNWGTTIYRNR